MLVVMVKVVVLIVSASHKPWHFLNCPEANICLRQIQKHGSDILCLNCLVLILGLGLKPQLPLWLLL